MTEKQCSECGTSKSLEEFYYHRKNGEYTTPYARCKRCHLDRTKRWAQNNPERVAELRWKQRGIELTWDEFEQMLAEQDSVCWICGRPDGSGRQLAPDHNHVTGTVRRLLCGWCNVLVGRIENGMFNPERLFTYLKEEDFDGTQSNYGRRCVAGGLPPPDA